jgi:CHASE3 domain sensor protein
MVILMNSRLLLVASLVPVVVVLQTAISASLAEANQYQNGSQWNQYSAQTCDPVNDPSTCRPG